MRPLLVGESYRGGGLSPETASGRRLCLVLRVSPDEYLEEYGRMNLCGLEWDAADARRAAGLVLLNAAYRTGSSDLVLFGRRVADSFGWVMGVGLDLLAAYHCGFVHIAVLPHPSGRCRLWSDRRTVRRARRVLRDMRGGGG